VRVWFDKPDLLGQMTRFAVIVGEGQGVMTLARRDGGHETLRTFPGVALALPDECWWPLPTDAMRPLMDALSAELNEVYAGDVAVLRRDYEHERARVDRLTDAIIAVGFKGTRL
jgi:hypothetical protein